MDKIIDRNWQLRALPDFAKKHGHFEQELSIRLVSTMDGNS
jgi:hypothetical protein